jgi:hypothetical protein
VRYLLAPEKLVHLAPAEAAKQALSMAETNCARWRRESVPVGLRGKGCEALAS